MKNKIAKIEKKLNSMFGKPPKVAIVCKKNKPGSESDYADYDDVLIFVKASDLAGS